MGSGGLSNQLSLPALRHHHRGAILFNLVLDQVLATFVLAVHQPRREQDLRRARRSARARSAGGPVTITPDVPREDLRARPSGRHHSAVRSFSARYASSTSGVGSAPTVREPVSVPGGRLLGAGERPGGLAGGAEGHVLRPRGRCVTSRPKIAGASCWTAWLRAAPPIRVMPAADGAGAVLERRDPVGEGAQQTLDVGAGDVLAGGRGAHAGEGGAGVGAVRGALAVEVGQQRHAVRAGHRAASARREISSWSTPSRVRAGLEDAGGVDGGGHRQEAASGVSEAGDGAAGVARAGVADHRTYPGGADRDGDVARALGQAERGAHVVPGAGGDHGARAGCGP